MVLAILARANLRENEGMTGVISATLVAILFVLWKIFDAINDRPKFDYHVKNIKEDAIKFPETFNLNHNRQLEMVLNAINLKSFSGSYIKIENTEEIYGKNLKEIEKIYDVVSKIYNIYKLKFYDSMCINHGGISPRIYVAGFLSENGIILQFEDAIYPLGRTLVNIEEHCEGPQWQMRVWIGEGATARIIDVDLPALLSHDDFLKSQTQLKYINLSEGVGLIGLLDFKIALYKNKFFIIDRTDFSENDLNKIEKIIIDYGK